MHDGNFLCIVGYLTCCVHDTNVVCIVQCLTCRMHDANFRCIVQCLYLWYGAFFLRLKFPGDEVFFGNAVVAEEVKGATRVRFR